MRHALASRTLFVIRLASSAKRLANECLLLDAGRVLQSGPVNQVFLRPANEAVVRLLGAENIDYGRVLAPHCIDVGCDVRLVRAG